MAVTIYPTGVTVYNPEKCWSGFTLFQVAELGAMLIDMNGTEQKLWKGVTGTPNKILPGGYLLTSLGERNPKFGRQDQTDLAQVDWDGKVVWKFEKVEYIEDAGEEPQWMARQHHDYQRAGNPVGYYAPNMEPEIDKGNTVILSRKNLYNHEISDKYLLDDYIVEIDWEGEIIWEWSLNEHFNELGFNEASKNIIYRDPNLYSRQGVAAASADWSHINSLSLLGPNKWYDAGDERFHPDNIIVCARELNISLIISKKTGEIVWKIGPYYDTPELSHIGWIIGQHSVHMIPKGLPGEGNILIFDNGGWAGYGAPSQNSPKGRDAALRDYSRVLEIDPVTLKIVWQYTPKEAGFAIPLDAQRFYSGFISNAQRLPNGNTLICEGSNGRVFEVTAEHELVWEFVNPYKNKKLQMNSVYRAYRVPYEWVPQIKNYTENPIAPVDCKNFRVPGASPCGVVCETQVEGGKKTFGVSTMCVVADIPEDE